MKYLDIGVLLLSSIVVACGSGASEATAARDPGETAVFAEMGEAEFRAWLEGSEWSTKVGNIRRVRFEDDFVLMFDDTEELYGCPYHIQEPGRLFYKYSETIDDRVDVSFAADGNTFEAVETRGVRFTATRKR